MAKILRKIIKIDEEKCNGCGQCVPSCEEGAIQIIDGKAKLVKDIYCDGLGACLGECPEGALTIEEREAEEFDLEAAKEHVAKQRAASQPKTQDNLPCGCPGTATQTIKQQTPCAQASKPEAAADSQLGNWPVQLRLVPPTAPYLDGARLLIAADCTPFALPDFHSRLLAGKILLMGCPKLDDAQYYREKLGQILALNDIRSIDIAYMEVPCCGGLVRLVQQAVADSGKEITVMLTKISIRGEVLETQALETSPAH